jgi:hypothetical protein
MAGTAEQQRLLEQGSAKADWQRWGPYLSERAWGTVREDYSADGDAWNYFPHDHARSRAYRWSEDGIGGWCDGKQHICLAVALWNERDPILKERMFGLTNGQGNHGEDVKEYYFYLEGTPTHSYMKMLYKYPQVAYPYEELVEVNGRRSQAEPEYELYDALRDAFTANRYFDIFVEYAKVNPEDTLCRITAVNRGPDPTPIHILPHLWYRNTWTWHPGRQRPVIEAVGPGAAHTEGPVVGERWWYARTADGHALDLWFAENETNLQRLYGVPNPTPYVKDGINDALVGSKAGCVNDHAGSKMAGHAHGVVAPGKSFTVQVRFSAEPQDDPFAGFDAALAGRIAETWAFYAALEPAQLGDDERQVARQAFAGLLWSKQFYHYDVQRWLEGDPGQPPPPDPRWHGRNVQWKHLNNDDVILMPDAWEYPWYASWDLAFHSAVMALIDPNFAKQQLLLMVREWYQHGNGDVPAYEWNFDDINPPVLAWAALRVFRLDRDATGSGDLAFLEEMFHGLALSLNWWLNRKDPDGRDIFGGGFLGMDNIGVFDRDKPLPDGDTLSQSDGTSWVGKFCANMLAIALELAVWDPAYENSAIKYFEHFLYIAHAMTNMSGEGIDLWDAQDRFFYDVVHLASGDNIPLRVHSMVGLVPLFAVTAAHPGQYGKLQTFTEREQWFLAHRPNLTDLVARLGEPGEQGTLLIALVDQAKLEAILERVLDESEFLSDYGIRALSRYHLEHPFVFTVGGQTFDIHYVPGVSDSRLFGGNSNWRGPIWFPANHLLIRAIEEFGYYYGDRVKVAFPTGSERDCTLQEVARELSRRLIRIFLRDPVHGGRRAVLGANDYFQNDPNWRDYIPFHEYFHGDTGAGLGASHQTGWTASVASLIWDHGGDGAGGPPTTFEPD